MEITIRNKDDMLYLASLFAKECKVGDVLLLNGDLGAGKTFFAQAFAKYIGVEEEVVSPTFTIAKEYNGVLPFFHIDAYRLEGIEEDLSFIYDYYESGVTFIEWPEYITNYLAYSYVQLYITVTGENSREISFSFVNSTTLENVVKEYEEYFSN